MDDGSHHRIVIRLRVTAGRQRYERDHRGDRGSGVKEHVSLLQLDYLDQETCWTDDRSEQAA